MPTQIERTATAHWYGNDERPSERGCTAPSRQASLQRGCRVPPLACVSGKNGVVSPSPIFLNIKRNPVGQAPQHQRKSRQFQTLEQSHPDGNVLQPSTTHFLNMCLIISLPCVAAASGASHRQCTVTRAIVTIENPPQQRQREVCAVAPKFPPHPQYDSVGLNHIDL